MANLDFSPISRFLTDKRELLLPSFGNFFDPYLLTLYYLDQKNYKSKSAIKRKSGRK